MLPTYWMILGVLLLIGEIFTLDFSLACFGLACFFAGIASWAGVNIYWQLGVLTVTIFIMLFSLRPFILKTLTKTAKEFKSNVEALIGREITVLSVNEADPKKALAKVDADEWTIVSQEALSAGDKVTVKNIDGTVLLVAKESK